MTVQEDSMDEENKQEHTIQSLESKGECLVSNRCSSELDPEQALISNVRSATSNCRELYIPDAHGFQSSFPKHITTSGEKYVLKCLELIRDYALRTEAWTLTSKVRILPDDLASCDMVRRAKECPLVNSSGEWTLGGTTDSPSMINVLKNPLLRQFGSIDANSITTELRDPSEPVPYNVADIRHKLINTMLDKSQKDAAVVKREHVSVSPPVHRRVVSVSSTNSSCSEQSSSSAPATSFQGMLQSTWNNGLPRHVFSVDDKREVYVANCYKMELLEDNALDYVYSFHSRRSEKELDSVAVMRVSTSISFCPDNSEVRETKYVLSVSDKDSDGKLPVLNQTHRKNKRSTRRSSKQRSLSRFPGSSSILEDIPWDPSDNAHVTIDPLEAISERGYMPNHELAAIVIKEISQNCQESDTGGWGLRFLKKSNKCLPSDSARNTQECSTSMDILIPAGLHGGPKTRGGSGPSSLIERWISGGCCDCGGWDIGCPLTILSTQSNSLDVFSSQADNSGQCKSVDLFIKGPRSDGPVFKMANIHEGLFYIHFQSSLSSLQSFAIAAAIIHSRSPSLRV